MTKTQLLEEAVRYANQKVRQELLSDTVSQYFRDKLVDISGSSMALIAAQWAPFVYNDQTESGYGYQLRIGDPLVFQLLKDENLFDRAEEIAYDAFFQIVDEYPRSFLTELLKDVISDE